MASPRDVAALVGTLRKDSVNRKVADALIALAPSSLRPAIVEIGRRPLCNQGDDATAPERWTAFRDRVHAASAILFVTLGYNRSVPVPLRNAIDVGLRPYGQSPWNGKPAQLSARHPAR